MTPEELREIGERLYGPKWQVKMARALPVTPRTIRYWLDGKRTIRPIIAERIKSLTRQPGHVTPPASPRPGASGSRR
jgi:hypothetical protein